jgi:hypothetical protein
MMPTPDARDSQPEGYEAGKRRWAKYKTCGVQTFAQMFPTPEAQNATGPGIHGQGGMDLQTAITRGSTGTDGDPSTPSGNGSLNPEWVTWLMGFPPGWLDD